MSPLPAGAPTPNHDTAPFWQGTAQRRIDLPVCDTCGLVVWYPRSLCPDCGSTDLTWTTMSGRGTVYSFSITRSGGGRAWAQHLPFVLAYVQLDEGPIMMTNVVECDVDDVRIGMPVAAVFDDTGEGSALVRFRPA